MIEAGGAVLQASPFGAYSEAIQAVLNMPGDFAALPEPARHGIASAFALAADTLHRYQRRAGTPSPLRGEQLPPVSADFEAGLAAYVDFSAEVLADRLRRRVQVQRNETGLFEQGGVQEDLEDIWATVSPEAVAERAEQIRLRLPEANDRELYARLLDRFVRAVEESGAELPNDEEERMQQLDLLLVRRPGLLGQAYRRMRHQLVVDVDVALPAELQSLQRLSPAARGLFGVFPADLNSDELAVAALLDASPQVQWWHRNPVKTGVGLYRWDEGEGFYPDFVVSVHGRPAPSLVLLEVKGEHLWGKESEVDKSGAVHRDYGPDLMAGRKRGEREFHFLRALSGKLQSAGAFSVDRLRFP